MTVLCASPAPRSQLGGSAHLPHSLLGKGNWTLPQGERGSEGESEHVQQAPPPLSGTLSLQSTSLLGV